MANEDKATRYHRLRRRTAFLATALGALFLLGLIVSGGSVALRAAVERLTAGSFTFTIILYVVVLALMHDLLQLPLAYYSGVTLERRYGLSTQTTSRWLTDHLKAGAIAVALAMVAALIVWSLLRWTPEWWWLLTAGCFALLLVAGAQLAPVLLLPLFYDIKPLARDTLAARLVALAERAGARVLGVFEWRLSDRTKKANAVLAGIGRTRRILVSDTLLAEHSDDEIEVILAHELAHHVHRDIWFAIALDTVLIVLGCYAADRVLAMFADGAGLAGKADVAGLPLLVLAGAAVSLVLRPIANAFSRAHERRADRYALDLTKNVAAFMSAMRRLAAQNLAEERPSRVVEWLFYTHPPTAARIKAAREWQERLS